MRLIIGSITYHTITLCKILSHFQLRLSTYSFSLEPVASKFPFLPSHVLENADLLLHIFNIRATFFMFVYSVSFSSFSRLAILNIQCTSTSSLRYRIQKSCKSFCSYTILFVLKSYLQWNAYSLFKFEILHALGHCLITIDFSTCFQSRHLPKVGSYWCLKLW